MYHLAREYGHGPVLIADIAEQERIPKKFLEAILWDLKVRGVVVSKRGKGGGYFLGRPPEEVTIGSIVRMIDGPLAPLPCASETAYRRCEECQDERSCGTRMIMRKVRDATAQILDHTTLVDACRMVDEAKSRARATKRRKSEVARA